MVSNYEIEFQDQPLWYGDAIPLYKLKCGTSSS
eukprot:COSAG02_NODE_49875_length_324_cov_0.688889_1_plen_32_part_01